MYKILSHQAGILGTIFTVNLLSINHRRNGLELNTAITIPVCVMTVAEAVTNELNPRRIGLLYIRNNAIAFSTIGGVYGIAKMHGWIDSYFK